MARPDAIEFLDKLPKTRSGKIMRRLLRAQELGQPIGDTKARWKTDGKMIEELSTAWGALESEGGGA